MRTVLFADLGVRNIATEGRHIFKNVVDAKFFLTRNS